MIAVERRAGRARGPHARRRRPARTLGLLDDLHVGASTATGSASRVDVAPEGEWTVPLPRLGLRLALPAAPRPRRVVRRAARARPTADTRRAARVGRFAASVDELQTPYVRPQENGNRTEVRWATLTDAAGAGLRVEGRPHFELTARRWTSEDLDAATHTPELVPRDRIWVNLDHAQQGIGTASCGPGVLPAAPPRGRADDLRAAPQSGIPFARVTCAYQRALSFGVRSSVSKST